MWPNIEDIFIFQLFLCSFFSLWNPWNSVKLYYLVLCSVQATFSWYISNMKAEQFFEIGFRLSLMPGWRSRALETPKSIYQIVQRTYFLRLSASCKIKTYCTARPIFRKNSKKSHESGNNFLFYKKPITLKNGFLSLLT